MPAKPAEEGTAILLEASAVSASTYAFQGIAMIRGLIIAKVLGPALYGLWNIMATAFSNAPVLGFGSLDAMQRQVPLNQGQSRSEANTPLIQTCLTWLTAATGLIAFAVFTLSFTGHVISHRMEIRLACLVLILNTIRIFVPEKLASERRFFLLSNLYLAYGALNAALGISLVFYWKINGVLVGMALANLIILGYLLKRGILSLRPSLDWRLLLSLIRIGFPIMVLSMTFWLSQSIDKVIVFIMLGKTHTGYFGLATFLSLSIDFIPWAVSLVIFPRMMETWGQTQERLELEGYFTKPLFVLAGIMPVLLGLIYINIDIPLVYLLPEYGPSIDVLRIFVLTLFFVSVWRMPRNLLIAFSKQKQLLGMVLFFLTLGAVADIAVIKLGMGIRGVALASLTVSAMITIVGNLYALICLSKDRQAVLSALARIYGPFLYVLMGLFVAEKCLPNGTTLIRDLGRSALFLIYTVPLGYKIEKESGLFHKMLKLTDGRISWK